ncbi:hypothetical protein DFH94DRAFT_684492 [Russula ochroleuca]|uniref:Uncharacterized protein n=1 Tax=Russula ochroleuca TaxID=152965 RepID=A0A9P5JZZ5_9AGAM|nr:hypothetical protein DFH94DRAFT_684492 [Russula ochroleuca]
MASSVGMGMGMGIGVQGVGMGMGVGVGKVGTRAWVKTSRTWDGIGASSGRLHWRVDRGRAVVKACRREGEGKDWAKLGEGIIGMDTPVWPEFLMLTSVAS